MAQVVHESLEVLELPLDRGADRQSRFLVDVVADQQARAVAQVLNRVGEIVDQARGDAAERRLALLPLDVFLQLDQPIGHRVERVAEVRELVAGSDVHSRIELTGGHRLRRALQRQDRRDERAPEHRPAEIMTRSATEIATNSCRWSWVALA